MATGVVKWFNYEMGCGGIMPDDAGAEVFVHYVDIPGGPFKVLVPGQKVSYDVVQSAKGPRAIHVESACQHTVFDEHRWRWS
ncbi:cold-shock protein [Pseudomonas sp. R2-7-07]|uniref:cold-shock protein n=1 Tax=Pseudomonas sp. R2-7-07 TaxID=658641 RepID=UPI000F55E3D6|nr:cold-shock protein [Pseudomonas sp. R2-7-07]AZF48856.1 Cold shock protein CspA [Pseudomonas sp. R2-7-07]